MKRGFTLVELLAVIVIIAIIAIIGVGGIKKVRQNIDIEMCNSTVKMVETGAVHYGEDFKNLLLNTSTNCTIDGHDYKCQSVHVSDLISKGYINTKDGNVVNPFNDEIINDKVVDIYIDNDYVYAKLKEIVCN